MSSYNTPLRTRVILCIGITLPLFYSCSQNRSQGKQLSFNKMGYDTINLFVYKVMQSDSMGRLIKTDTLGLFCTNRSHPNPGQKLAYWQMLTIDGNNKLDVKNYNNTEDGILTTDTELFIHPPRDYYRILQFCPYPAFKSCGQIGDKWSWDFNVGHGYAIYPTYPIEAGKTIKITSEYFLKDTATLNTDMGKLFCYHVTAKASSKYGVSFASFYINNQYGLIDFEFKPIDKTTLEFKLVNKFHDFYSGKFNPRIKAFLVPSVKNKSDNYFSIK
jgi:hypothetical protein